MNGDFDACYLSVHGLHGSHTYRDTDLLLEGLKEVHGNPHYDIPPEMAAGRTCPTIRDASHRISQQPFAE
jgi:hypothetical protein